MTEKIRFVRLGTVFSVRFERVSLLLMPTHYSAGARQVVALTIGVSNPVGSAFLTILSINNGRYRG